MVFIDELDAVGRERGLIKGSGGQERDATLNQVPNIFRLCSCLLRFSYGMKNVNRFWFVLAPCFFRWF